MVSRILNRSATGERRSRKSFGLHVLCHDQTCAPFVTWHFAGALLNSIRRQCRKVAISAPGVHLIAWECVRTRFTVKNLDSMGMKYTNWVSRFLALFLATFAGLASLHAQSAYVSGVAT